MLTTMEQMRMASERSLSAASDVAKAAAEAIREALDILKADKPKATTISIAADGRVASESTTYPYQYDIEIEDITANDRAVITIDPESVDTAVACGLCPSNESMAGLVRLYSVSVPESSIAAEYWIETGKE